MTSLCTHAAVLKPAIHYGEVHIWGGFLNYYETPIKKFVQLLSPEEWGEAQRFHFKKNRIQYILRHGILRIILGIYLNANPASLKFDCGEYGKPFLVGQKHDSKILFNLSHSGDFFLIGVNRDSKLGIDVERMQEMPEICKIAERHFSKNENRVFQQLQQSKRKEAFYNCWTRKEALIKATGLGLSQPLDSFDVSLIPGEPARLLSSIDDPQTPSRWTLLDFKPAPGFAAALAVEGPVRRIQIWIDSPVHENKASSGFSKIRFDSSNFQTLSIRPASAY